MQLPSTVRRRAAALGLVAATVTAMVAVTAAPAVGAAGEGVVLHEGGPTAVAGSYIVVFKDSAVSPASVADRARSLASRFGGQLGVVWGDALRGFEVSTSARSAARIAADPSVAYVEQNHRVWALETQSPTPSWGLDRIDQRNLPLNNSYTYPTRASGVRAYIIDTGIRFTHTDFGGRAVTGFDAIDGGSADDCNGHGTHVAGTTGGNAYGVAKSVTLVGVRVLDCNGSGTYAQVISGINWVTGDHDPGELAVANMSLGGPADTATDNAVTNSINDGVTYALAAGNSNADACTSSPARTPAAITVGATQNNDARASFSNWGTCLDIFAPGVSITSAWNTSDTATNTISGTSMASPHTAGVAALVVAQNPSFTPQQVRDYMVNNATSGVVTSPGTGSPNKLLFVVNGTPPANDFSISVSPSSGSVVRGGSVSATVSTATTSGSPQTVNLSASGLPAGATATFNPSTITSGGSSSMTIATSTTTPTGTFPITITGTGTSVTRSTTFTLTVTGTGGCGSPGQKLVNPGFESGATGWSATAGVIGQWGAFGQPPRSGTWNAWLDGYGTNHTDTLSQAVALPAGCTSYALSFWLHIDTAETTTTIAYDTLRVQVIAGGATTTLATYSNLNKAAGYQLRSFSLAAWAGQSITLRFIGVEDITLQTSFVIDDTALNVS